MKTKKKVRASLDDVRYFLDHGIDFRRRIIYLGDERKGIIDHWVAERVIKALNCLTYLSVTEPIHFILNSNGGIVSDGFAIFDAIKQAKCPTIADVYGQASSMASVILQAMDVRRIMPNAYIMLHDGEGGGINSPRSIESWANFGKVQRQRFYEIYSSRTDLPISHWEKVCAFDSIFTADQALACGLVDEIINSSPSKSP